MFAGVRVSHALSPISKNSVYLAHSLIQYNLPHRTPFKTTPTNLPHHSVYMKVLAYYFIHIDHISYCHTQQYTEATQTHTHAPIRDIPFYMYINACVKFIV